MAVVAIVNVRAHPRAPDLTGYPLAAAVVSSMPLQIAQFAFAGGSVLLVAAQSSAMVRASRRDVLPTIVVRLLIVADVPLARKEHAVPRFLHVHAPRADVVLQAAGDGIGDVYVVPDAVLGRHQAGHERRACRAAVRCRAEGATEGDALLVELVKHGCLCLVRVAR